MIETALNKPQPKVQRQENQECGHDEDDRRDEPAVAILRTLGPRQRAEPILFLHSVGEIIALTLGPQLGSDDGAVGAKLKKIGLLFQRRSHHATKYGSRQSPACHFLTRPR